MRKSGQSALEFLMTYGWAILVVLVFIAALYFFGVFDTSRYIPRHCDLQPGLECTTFKLMRNDSNHSMALAFMGRNSFGYDIGFAVDSLTLQAENIGGEGRNNYTGTCSPSVVRKGRTYTCVIGIENWSRVPALGEMRRTQFSLNFTNCETDPNYRTTGNCFTGLTQNHTLTGEITTQMEPYSLNLCGNGVCDDNFGETNVTCPVDCNYTAMALLLTADPDTIPANGTSTSLITATVLDMYGYPIGGATVTFDKNTTEGAFNTNTNTTNSLGQASVILTSGIVETTVRVNATSGSSAGETAVTFAAVPLGCGDVLLSNTVLNSDLSFTGPGCCLTFGANGITLNGVGHTITSLDGAGDGVCAINRTGVTATRLALNHTRYGIYFQNTNDSFITSNNAIPNNAYGIYLNSSNRNGLTGNNANSNINYGIALNSSNSNIISGSSTNADQYGIYLSSSNSNTISGSNATSDQYGIYLTGSSSNLISSSNASSNSNTGIYVLSSTNNDLTSNTASNNSIYGIVLNTSNSNRITGNNASLNKGYAGIIADTSNYNNFTGNTANNNSQVGIALNPRSNWSLVTGNTAKFNGGTGITLGTSYYDVVSGNNAHNNTNGIYVGSVSQHNNITWNNCSNNSASGISSWNGAIVYTDFNLYANNTLLRNNVGLSLSVNTSFNNVTGNTINFSTAYGISISSSNNSIANNTVCFNTLGDLSCGGTNNTGTDRYDTNSGCGTVQNDTCAGLINNCMVITRPGTYNLTRSFSFTGGICCINISSNDVYFDGKGYKITGDGSAGSMGACAFHRTNVTINNLTLDPVNYGIYFSDTNNSRLISNNATNNTYGIYLTASNRNNLTRNIANNNTQYGIFLTAGSAYNRVNFSTANFNYVGLGASSANSNSNTFDSNTILNSTNYGIAVQSGASYNNVTNNTVKFTKYRGIDVWNGGPAVNTYNRIIGNTVANTTAGPGISVKYSSYNVFQNNNIQNNTGDGIILWSGADYNNVTGNNFTSNTVYGIEVGTAYNNITNNNASRNLNSGIYVTVNNNRITGNTASNNTNYGIYLLTVTGNNVSGNTANSNNIGIYLNLNADSNIVSGNIANSNNAAGIRLDNSSRCSVTSNNASLNTNDGIGLYANGILSAGEYNNLTGNKAGPGNRDGIRLDSLGADRGPQHNILANNNASRNNRSGIWLMNAWYNNLTDNNASNNNVSAFSAGIVLEASWYTQVIRNIANSNGPPGDGTGAGIWVNTTSNYNTIAWNTANSNRGADPMTGYGIRVAYSANNSIANNTAKFNTNYGIYLLWGGRHSITRNNATNNGMHGIALSYSGDNNLSNNNASLNSQVGIYLDYSNRTKAASNTANDNSGSGIVLQFSDYNNFTGNTASSNDGTGLSLRYSSDYNNFTSNTFNQNTYDGIAVGSGSDTSTNNNITGNTVQSNGVGISTTASGNNYTSNSIRLNSNGVKFEYTAANNKFQANTITGNTNDVYCETNYVNNDKGNTCSSEFNCESWLSSCHPPFCGSSISSCCLINSTGTFTLTSSITATGTCITIGSGGNNAKLNCNGKSITGPGSTYYGIFLSTARANVTNCRVTGFYSGLYLYNSDYSNITYSNFSSNVQGMRLEASDDNSIDYCLAGPSNTNGIWITGSSWHNDFVVTNASSNTQNGIVISSGSQNDFTSAYANSNGRYGFDSSGTNTMLVDFHACSNAGTYDVYCASSQMYIDANCARMACGTAACGSCP